MRVSFSIPVPVFIARWIWPHLLDTAERHGKASRSTRVMGGGIETIVVAEMVE